VAVEIIRVAASIVRRRNLGLGRKRIPVLNVTEMTKPPIPHMLYKYHSYNTQVVETLARKSIWVSAPNTFNDPFDCHLRVSTDGVSRDQLQELLDAINRRNNRNNTISTRQSINITEEDPAQLTAMLQQHSERLVQDLTRVAVYSLTENRNNNLMWAHYTQLHTGFVIGFETSSLDENDYMKLIKVDYVDQSRGIEVSDVAKFDDTDFQLRTVAKNKSRHWRKENEWRIVYGYPYMEGVRDMPMTPAEVVFGYRMGGPTKALLYQVISSQFSEVEFFVARPSETKFRLDYLPYTNT